MSDIPLSLPARKRDAIIKEAARAFRSGDIALAQELCSVAGQLEADELRRMTADELRLLNPEFSTGVSQ